MDEYMRTLLANMPPLAAEPWPTHVFMTHRQFDVLKRYTAAAPPFLQRPDDLGVVAPLAGVQVVLLPERTWWQRFRARLRRWRWWR
ncbi:hypothetical protein BBK82_03270 [Lentzea guizhouensis]|uniref:Uncharacterized protein n=2 Tax=Lentzea guizhouensis TaxID=1586287 RepID=A0A1B2HBY2_9PSEU|nr:hypothetical protein BBK82_03270 [Lentzea guizhouensis]